jgi:hypothetical protein
MGQGLRRDVAPVIVNAYDQTPQAYSVFKWIFPPSGV